MWYLVLYWESLLPPDVDGRGLKYEQITSPKMNVLSGQVKNMGKKVFLLAFSIPRLSLVIVLNRLLGWHLTLDNSH